MWQLVPMFQLGYLLSGTTSRARLWKWWASGFTVLKRLKAYSNAATLRGWTMQFGGAQDRAVCAIYTPLRLSWV